MVVLLLLRKQMIANRAIQQHQESYVRQGALFIAIRAIEAIPSSIAIDALTSMDSGANSLGRPTTLLHSMQYLQMTLMCFSK